MSSAPVPKPSLAPPTDEELKPNLTPEALVTPPEVLELGPLAPEPELELEPEVAPKRGLDPELELNSKSRPPADDPKVLAALAAANLNWVKQPQSVWSVHDDVPQIHADIRKKFARHVAKLKNAPNLDSLTGLTILGNPGAGKTRLRVIFITKPSLKTAFSRWWT